MFWIVFLFYFLVCVQDILLLLSMQILFQFPQRSTVWHHVQIITRSTTELTPVVESLQARKPGLQAPSNLAGSKIKNNQFFPFLILSQRCNNKYWEKHVPCYLSLFNNQFKMFCPNLKLVAKCSQAPGNFRNQLAGSMGDSATRELTQVIANQKIKSPG